METQPEIEPNTTDPTTPVVERVRHWYRGLPDKKRYLEFVTAFLTIPVLLTVLLSNVSNLQSNKQRDAALTPTAAPAAVATVRPTSAPLLTDSPVPQSTPTATPLMQCTPGIGPIEIAYPTESSAVSEDPVCLDIPRQNSNYCAVVWSYRINGGSWSNYTDREICMYGLTPGTKQLDLRVKSISNGDEKILKRTFTIPESITPTPATQSGTVETPQT